VVRELLGESEMAMIKAREALSPARLRAVRATAAFLLADPLSVLARFPATQDSFDVFTVAEFDIPLAQARHLALLCVLRAEKLEDEGKKDTDEWKRAAIAADTAQRHLAVLESRRSVLTFQQTLRKSPSQSKSQATRTQIMTHLANAES